ncbi:translation initiation factor 2 [Streptomyces sp. NPDC046712]|uniref:translation initiation factor 2 n=1 Tax=Streptomyces sp. NPDC046712 TaxID=3154802 RepID=UPI0033F5D362
MSAALEGLALNPAAPVDILLRLLDSGDGPVHSALCAQRREIPEEVVDAIVAHPLPRVRGGLARNAQVSGELRGRVVDDEDWFVRLGLARGPRREAWPRHLPDGVIDRMYATYEAEALQELSFSRQVPGRLLRASAEREPVEDDAEEMERRLRALPGTRSHAHSHILVNCRLSRAVVDELLLSREDDDLWCLAHNYSTPPDVVAHVARVGDPTARLAVARRADLPRDLVELLARDPDPAVRTAVSVRPELTEDERAAIDYVVEPLDLVELGEDPYRAPLSHARSAHPLLRRRVAHNPELPDELVALLAGDDDLGVRVLLAQYHPKAAPQLLLRCYLEYEGRNRNRLLGLPQFPTTGLGVRFGSAADPAVRLLATHDPALDPAVAVALTRDADPRIRAAAARNPTLPRRRLHQLLEDEELSKAAAANPALPVETMYRLLAEA